VAGSLTFAFAEAVRQARSDRGISQEELGRRSGLHRAHVGEIERGEVSPTLDSVEAIARALEMRPSDLIQSGEERGATSLQD
jgi:transcriptional regulator with XRE-family HTH domain